jgi:hypothetical protein
MIPANIAKDGSSATLKVTKADVVLLADALFVVEEGCDSKPPQDGIILRLRFEALKSMMTQVHIPDKEKRMTMEREA